MKIKTHPHQIRSPYPSHETAENSLRSWINNVYHIAPDDIAGEAWPLTSARPQQRLTHTGFCVANGPSPSAREDRGVFRSSDCAVLGFQVEATPFFRAQAVLHHGKYYASSSLIRPYHALRRHTIRLRLVGSSCGEGHMRANALNIQGRMKSAKCLEIACRPRRPTSVYTPVPSCRGPRQLTVPIGEKRWCICALYSLLGW